LPRFLRILGAFCLFLAFPALAAADQSGSINVILGYRSFDSEEWAPLDDQPVLGVNVELVNRGWPFEVLLGLSISYDDATVMRNVVTIPEVEFTTVEFSFGVQKTWEDLFINARPYVGGGLSIVGADVDVTLFGNNSRDDDVTLGLYLNGGYFWEFGENFRLGFEGKVLLGTDISLGENDKTIVGSGFDADNVDYAQLGLLAGWSW
jgi:hypothetical protein